jgi:hypothetical protein
VSKQRVPPLCFTGGMRLGCGGGRTQPARLRALCDVLRCMAERASSVSYETRCGGVLEAMHNRSPFAIKPSGAHTIHCALAWCASRLALRSSIACTENAIPHMVAELWLRTPLH